MYNFDRVLSDEETAIVINDGCVDDLFSLAERVEQAVVAKLAAEQEPVAWRVYPFDYGVGVEGAYAITQQEDLKDVWECKEWEVTPLYEHPIPNCQGILVNSGYIPDVGNMIPEGYALVPVEITAEMLRDAHIRSELGAYAVSNLSEGYSLIRNLYDVLLASAPKYTGEK